MFDMPLLFFKWEVIFTDLVNLKKDNHKGKGFTFPIIFVEIKIPSTACLKRVEMKPSHWLASR